MLWVLGPKMLREPPAVIVATLQLPGLLGLQAQHLHVCSLTQTTTTHQNKGITNPIHFTKQEPKIPYLYTYIYILYIYIWYIYIYPTHNIHYIDPPRYPWILFPPDPFTYKSMVAKVGPMSQCIRKAAALGCKATPGWIASMASGVLLAGATKRG